MKFSFIFILLFILALPFAFGLELPTGIQKIIEYNQSQAQFFAENVTFLIAFVIGFLSFIVWLHHFFTMGAGADVNAFFGIATMIIAIPTGVKVFNWLFTMYKGRIILATPMLWVGAFFTTFAIGGMTGVMLAIPPVDFQLHNSLFLVAHFHNVIIGGVLFGYFVIVPMSVNFFATFKVSDVVVNQFSIDSYIGMVKTSVIACGLFFELPIIIYFLTKLGLVTPTFLRKYWKYAVIIILIVAAIVTPPDVVSQVIVAIPMLLIYEVSIFISAVVVKNQNKING